MKILKYLLFTLLALFGIFFLLGVMMPSVDYGHTIKVNKSIDEAWTTYLDASKYDQWLEGFKSIELISGEQGAVGSKYKVIVTPQPGQPDFEMTQTITSRKDHDHISLSFDSDMMVFNQTTRFSEQGGATTVSTESEVNGKGMMMRSMFVVMELLSSPFQEQEVNNIEALKKVIESN